MDPQPPPFPSSPHFLIVSLSVQSHLNPVLQLALRLLHSNIAGLVTLATPVSASIRITTHTTTATTFPSGLRFATFSDGHDDPSGYKGRALGRDGESYMSALRHRGAETLSDLISRTNSPKFDCVIYTILNSFAAGVALRHGLPSAVLWVQPAAMLQLYHCYFTGHADAIHNAFLSNSSSTDPAPLRPTAVELPGLPRLTSDEIPALFSPSSPAHSPALAIFCEIFEELSRQPVNNRTVLANTFEELESEPLKALRDAGKFEVIPVGPLLPLNGVLGLGVTYNQLDLFKRSEEQDYVSWLDSKPDSSVVYVSFGSISVLSGRMVRELASGLIETNRPFLWVIKPKDQGTVGEEEAEIMKWLEDQLELRTGKERVGMVVPWCNQVEVLSHRAVGCFVSHCGWNSSLESLGYGVPVVALPHWIDQLTNAKLLEDVWKVGVRAARGGEDEDDDGDEKVASVFVDSREISRCVEKVMESDSIKRNSRRWKELAAQAVGEGGSSEANLREFVEQVVGGRKRVKNE